MKKTKKKKKSSWRFFPFKPMRFEQTPMTFKTAVKIQRNCFNRWILRHVRHPELAWSGERFVPCTQNGTPAGVVQVSNFDTYQEAFEEAITYGFEVRT